MFINSAFIYFLSCCQRRSYVQSRGFVDLSEHLSEIAILYSARHNNYYRNHVYARLINFRPNSTALFIPSGLQSRLVISTINRLQSHINCEFSPLNINAISGENESFRVNVRHQNGRSICQRLRAGD